MITLLKNAYHKFAPNFRYLSRYRWALKDLVPLGIIRESAFPGSRTP